MVRRLARTNGMYGAAVVLFALWINLSSTAFVSLPIGSFTRGARRVEFIPAPLSLGRSLVPSRRLGRHLVPNVLHGSALAATMVMDTASAGGKMAAATREDFNRERSEQRREQNLDIADKVAKGELAPLVVSFSPRIRDGLRLPGRYRHLRLFVHPSSMSSLSSLSDIITDKIPKPMLSLPTDCRQLCLRRVAEEGEEGEAPAIPLESDEALKEAYQEVQRSRVSGVGKLRIIVQETDKFAEYLAHQRGYATNQDGSIGLGLRPQDATAWIMVSFYSLKGVPDVEDLTGRMRASWEPLGVLGRVYVADEGVNVQVSVPDNMMDMFESTVSSMAELEGVYLNNDDPLGIDQLPFSKLQIKPRKQVLADGFGSDVKLDWSNNGAKLSPGEWHDAIQRAGNPRDANAPVLLDVRNFYESKVGYFEGAKALNTTTFRDTWGAFKEALQGVPSDRQILTYCTGGIRCEKANAYLIQEMGFSNVGALKGGIVNYYQYVQEKNLTSRFLGVNHVFDQRLGQRVGDKVLSSCDFCGCASDVQTDCANAACPRPFSRRRFVQCPECAAELGGGCCYECQDEATAREKKKQLQAKGDELRRLLTKTKADARGKTDEAYQALMAERAAQIDAELSRVQAGVAEEDAKVSHAHAMAERAVGGLSEGPESSSQDQPEIVMDPRNHLGSGLDPIAKYAEEHSTAEHEYLTRVREYTIDHMTGRSHMLSGAVQAQFLSMMVSMTSSKRVLEIGCFTGYSALALASGVPDGGSVTTIEKDERTAEVARRHFEQSPWASIIQLIVGDGMEVLQELEGEYDFVFLDANKKQYSNYLLMMLERGILREGGVLIVDNVLWKGRVVELQNMSPEERVAKTQDRQKKGVMSLVEADKYAAAMQSFNDLVRDDPRVECVMLPMRDGLSIIRRIK